jgi:PAS domain S-box-containing protein
MTDETLLEQAALYAAGAMSAREREQFGLIAESHDVVRAIVAGFEEVTAMAALATGGPRHSAGLKSRILSRLDEGVQQRSALKDGFVITNASGFVQWVNSAFTQMCGYTADELHGKKLGPILQGEKTDRAAAERMRRAIHAHEPCLVTILNYRKNGTPYWVEIAITPITDDAGELQCFVAHQREMPDPLPA